MKKDNKIKILHLEDVSSDADLVARVLKKSITKNEIRVVSNKASYEEALREFSPDIVLADHSLPTYDSIKALKLLKRVKPLTPFILVTGTVSEEFAVEMMKEGLTDYILKDRLQRLPSAIQLALESTRKLSEKLELEKKNELLASIVNHSEDAIYSTDVNGQIMSWNLGAEKIFGYKSKEVIGKNHLMLFPDYLRNFDQAILAKFKKGISIEKIETESKRKNAEVINTSVSISPINDLNGKLIGISWILRDITVRKKVEREMSLLINNTEEGFILVDRNLNIVSYNNKFQTLYKKYFSLNVKKGDSILNYAQSENVSRLKQIYKDVLKGEVAQTNLSISDAKKNNKLFTIKYSPARDAEDKIVGVFVTTRDITELKKLEEQQKYERRDKEALINSTDDLIWSVSSDFNLLAFNKAFEETMLRFVDIQFKPGDNLIRTKHFPKDYLKFWKQQYERALSGESFKKEIYTPSYGKHPETWMETSFNPIFDQKKITGIACCSRYITERKKAEKKIMHSEERLREAQAIAMLGNWETDLATMNVIWSAETYRIFGMDPKRFKTTHGAFLELVHLEDRTRVNEAFINSFENGSLENVIEHRIVTPSGIVKHVEERWKTLLDNDGNPFRVVGTCQDITHRKKVEDGIRDLTYRLQIATSSAGLGIFDWDIESNELIWDDQMYKIFDVSKEKFSGAFEAWSNTVHPDDLAFALDEVQAVIEGRKEFHTTFRILNSNKEVNFISGDAIVLRDAQGKALRMIGVNRNITQQKKAEEEREKISLDLLQQNKDLQQFTYIVSHNLRAPVANIMGAAEALRTMQLDEEEREDMLAGLSASVIKLNTVILDLNTILQLKRNVSENKETVSFSHLIKNIHISLSNQIKADRVEIRTDFMEIDKILTLKSYLYSVFYNLITNSIKYKQPDQNPVISIKSIKFPDKIELHYSDNGMGIDLTKKGSQVFGLYKRFHNHKEGKGMGLFMTKTQVESLGGKISIESEVNKGTKFVIQLPV